MIEITRAVQTCAACPSQWDAWDTDGNYYYLRYRHGHGEMIRFRSERWMDAPYPEGTPVTFGNLYELNPEFVACIAAFDHGDPLDGSISLAGFCELAGVRLSPGAVYTGFGDHLRDELVTEAGFTFLLEP